jgi:hypothetical protein
VVGVRVVEGGSIAALHGGDIEGQDGEPEEVSEGSLELSTLECKSCWEQEGIQPGRCGAAGEAKEAGSRTLTVPSCKEATKASAQAWAKWRQKALCGSEMVSMLSWLSTSNYGHHRVSTLSCKPLQFGRSCSPPGPWNGRDSVGAWRRASWVVATAERYAASPSSRPVCFGGGGRWGCLRYGAQRGDRGF